MSRTERFVTLYRRLLASGFLLRLSSAVFFGHGGLPCRDRARPGRLWACLRAFPRLTLRVHRESHDGCTSLGTQAGVRTEDRGAIYRASWLWLITNLALIDRSRWCSRATRSVGAAEGWFSQVEATSDILRRGRRRILLAACSSAAAWAASSTMRRRMPAALAAACSAGA